MPGSLFETTSHCEEHTASGSEILHLVFSVRAWCQIDHCRRWIRTVWPFKKWVWFFSSFFSIPPLFTHGYKSPGGSDPIIDVVGRGEEWGLEWFGLYWTDSLWSHWEEELGHLKDYWQVCLRKVIFKYGKAGIFVEVWIILYRSSAWFHPTSFIHRLQFCHLKNTIEERAHVQSMSNHLSFTSLCQTTFAGSDAEEICRWTFFFCSNAETAVNGMYLFTRARYLSNSTTCENK